MIWQRQQLLSRLPALLVPSKVTVAHHWYLHWNMWPLKSLIWQRPFLLFMSVKVYLSYIFNCFLWPHYKHLDFSRVTILIKTPWWKSRAEAILVLQWHVMLAIEWSLDRKPEAAGGHWQASLTPFSTHLGRNKSCQLTTHLLTFRASQRFGANSQGMIIVPVVKFQLRRHLWTKDWEWSYSSVSITRGMSCHLL